MGSRLCATCRRLHVLPNPKNLGYGGNQKAGYRYQSKTASTSWCCFMATASMRRRFLIAPRTIPSWRDEADAVFGSRMMKTYGGPLKGGMPLYKYAGNRILTTFREQRC